MSCPHENLTNAGRCADCGLDPSAEAVRQAKRAGVPVDKARNALGALKKELAKGDPVERIQNAARKGVVGLAGAMLSDLLGGGDDEPEPEETEVEVVRERVTVTKTVEAHYSPPKRRGP